MRNLVSSLVLALALTAATLTGCSSKDASCDKVVDHTLELMPKEMAAAVGSNRDAMVKQCKDKLSKAERNCAASAKSMEDLQKCKRGS